MSSASQFSPVKRSTKCPLSINEKTIILNVYNALVHQHPNAGVVKVTEMCSQMTGVGLTSVYKIVRESKSGILKSPKPKTGRRKLILDENEKQLIRKTVHSFYFNKELPTLDKVLKVLNSDSSLPKISRDKLWKTLKEMNFEWETQNRKSLLIEKQEIISWRRKYLRLIKKYRNENRKIYYLDETWVNEGHTVKKMWQDKNIKSSRQAFLEGLSTGIKPPSGKGKRLIVTHIGSEDGFVEGGLLTFQSRHTGDYHEDMNADVFEEYFEQMLDLIPPGSVIVLDNASYHSRKIEKIPTTAWRKGDIKQWLSEKEILFEEDMVKKELLTIVSTIKHEYSKCVVDEMAEKRQIIVLRLPPYHCELNPIELVWAEIKNFVSTRNTTYKMKDVELLFHNAIDTVTPEKWRRCVEHVIKEEKKMWQLDNMLDDIEPIIISVDESDISTDFSADDLETE